MSAGKRWTFKDKPPAEEPAEEPANSSKQRAEKKRPERPLPKILNCAELLMVETETEEMLFGDGYSLPAYGLTLKVGAPKSGKTLLAVQEALAVARDRALFDNYRVRKPGPVMIIEQDDPNGAASIKTIVQRCGGTQDLPLYVVPSLPFGFGPALLDWLKAKIAELSLKLVVLDSYTSLRGPRPPGGDFVKQEQTELRQVDALGKEALCAIEMVHHASKGAVALDWTQSAAGSYAMAGATEAQIHLSRFGELDGSAPERLVRIRGRHSTDEQVLLRFRKDTLDYEHVLDGGAAEFYPILKQIKSEVEGETFSPKELSKAIGMPIATVHRLITRLCYADALKRRGYGCYELSPGLKL
jgi:hypothetical protein